MKKTKKVSLFLATVISIASILNCTSVSAETKNAQSNIPEDMSIVTNSGLTFTAETIDEFEDAVLIDETLSYPDYNTYEVDRTYQLDDGTIVHDIMTVSSSNSLARSREGKNTVTRKVDASNFATVYICATFDWKYGTASKVRCSSMTAYYVRKSTKTACLRFIKDYDSEYVSIGNACAQVNYYFYNKDLPFQSSKGIFKVTCTDDGTISDNG